MIKDFAFRRLRLLAWLIPCALLACGGGGSGGLGGSSGQGTGGNNNSGGSSGSGGGGSGGSATGGSGSGGHGSGGNATGGNGSGGNVATGGITGAGGSATGGNATGGMGSGGVTGTGGSANGGAGGKGGQAGGSGSGGATGGSSGFVPYVCPSGMSAPSASAFPSGNTAVQVPGAPPIDNFDGNQGNGFSNVEGPVWISNALYFSEMTGNNPPPSRLLKIDASNAVSQFYPSGGGGDSGSNGNAVDMNGNLVAASHGVGGIVSFTVPGGTKTTIISSYNGKRFNSPNDLTISSNGTIYFTDPNFQAPSPTPQPNTGVYMVKAGASTATEIISTLSNPNGITLSLDEKALYVGHGGGVYSYAVNADGTIGTTATHVDATNLDNNATDGMAIDCAGDLYVVRVNTKDIDVVSFGGNAGSYNPNSAGTHLTTLTGIANAQLTNAAFGGTDHKTLYVTAQGSKPNKGVFKLTMPLPGMPY
jgi:gluconolactonase